MMLTYTISLASQYDRAKLAKPQNMNFSKVQRVNFAFFQTNVNGDIWGTDSWADANLLFGVSAQVLMVFSLRSNTHNTILFAPAI